MVLPWLGLCHNTLTPARASRFGQYLNTLTPARLSRLGQSHNTLTPARTSRLLSNVVTHCIMMWGLSWAMTRSLHNSIHPPEMDINPPKTAWRVLSFWNALVFVTTIAYTGWPPECSFGEHYKKNNDTLIHTRFSYRTRADQSGTNRGSAVPMTCVV